MFGINDGAARAFHQRSPATFEAMQHLVMALDDCAKNLGRKTLFGRDKSQEYLAKLALQMGRTIVAMRADRLLDSFTEPQAIHELLQTQLNSFFEAFPTWLNAKAFAQAFFTDRMSLSIIEAHVRTVR